jgi:hypothetical protein
VLLYGLTSTYFEGAMEDNPKAKRGYSRDGLPDCLPVVVALVVTTDGFPLAYEVMNGNTTDCTTLRGFLDKIEKTYGKAKRMWGMDRGIPTEAVLAEMRDPACQVYYLVGTSKSKIKQPEKKWLDLPWQKVRDSVEVKLLEQDGELYVLAKSDGRQDRGGPRLRFCEDTIAGRPSTGDARVFSIPRGSGQAQRGGSAPRTLSASLQPHGWRSQCAVVALCPTGADRVCLPQLEKPARSPADPPSTGASR